VSEKFLTLASSDIFCIAVAIQGEVIASQVCRNKREWTSKDSDLLEPNFEPKRLV